MGSSGFGGRQNVEDKLFDKFLKYGHKKIVEKDEMIYNPADSEQKNCAYFLVSGLVGLTTIAKDGDERVYLYFKDRRLIGFAPMLLLTHSSHNQAVGRMRKIGRTEVFQIAKTRCELYQLREADYKHLLDTDFEFNRLVNKVLVENYVDLLDHFRQALEETAGIRFCRLLLESYVERDGKKILPKAMTFLEMSKYLGTHPVTVSRIVALLKKDGCIAKEQGVVVIKDEDRLLELITSGEDIK